MTTILSANGLIEIPEAFRETDALKPGQACEIERVGRGEYHLRVGDPKGGSCQKERLIDLLLNCPVKDFFSPMDRSETTDELKPVAFE